MTDDPSFIVDGRFTHEGFSVSVYDADDMNAVVDEAWFTWAEIELLKGEGSDFTFELG